MCVLNPGYVAIYSETLKPGLIERLKKANLNSRRQKHYSLK